MVVYKIVPCRVINKSIELEQQIYSAYIAFIKMINFNYQIIIETKVINFNNLIDNLNKNIYLSNDYFHKSIMEEYKNYLHELSNEINIYDRQFYFIVEQLDIEKEKRLKEGGDFLQSIGVKIDKVKDDDEIFKLMYESINKI